MSNLHNEGQWSAEAGSSALPLSVTTSYPAAASNWFVAMAAASAVAVKHVTSTSWCPTISSAISIQHEDATSIPAERYEALRNTCKSMSELSADEALFIDNEALVGGLAFVNVLETFEIAPPKVFSHGGDALVFTWSTPDSRRYVTTVGSEASVRDYSLTSDVSRSETYDLSDTRRIYGLAGLLGGKLWKQLRIATQSPPQRNMFVR